jgi:alpha-mannosidase
LRRGAFCVRIDGNGEISRLFDKNAARELVSDGRTLNHLAAFQDIPKDYDAWNIDEGYERKCWAPDAPEKLEIAENGPAARICPFHKAPTCILRLRRKSAFTGTQTASIS